MSSSSTKRWAFFFSFLALKCQVEITASISNHVYVIHRTVNSSNSSKLRAVVVAQLVERALPTPEIHGSNPNIGKVLSSNCKLKRKDENKGKEAGNGPL